jgi:hypothetical protein
VNPADIAESVHRSRVEQGLPERVTDPVTIARVAATLRLSRSDEPALDRVGEGS